MKMKYRFYYEVFNPSNFYELDKPEIRRGKWDGMVFKASKVSYLSPAFKLGITTRQRKEKVRVEALRKHRALHRQALEEYTKPLYDQLIDQKIYFQNAIANMKFNRVNPDGYQELLRETVEEIEKLNKLTVLTTGYKNGKLIIY